MGKNSETKRTIYIYNKYRFIIVQDISKCKVRESDCEELFKVCSFTQSHGTRPHGNSVYVISGQRINWDEGKGKTEFLPYVISE